MAKKITALLLSGLMAVSCLAGCTPAVNESTGSTAATATEASQTSSNDNDPVAALIAATTGTVDLEVWASEEDQEFTQGLIKKFEEKYAEVDFNITLGAVSESTAKDTILADVSAAADVFAFADDQIPELVKAGALQPISNSYTMDVRGENVAASVEAATINGTLYAYPMTADNGYFMYYDKSIYTEEDVKSLDAMIEKAKASNTKIAFELANAWYLYSFFQGAGYDCYVNEDGITNTCNWNAAGGTDVAQAIIDYVKGGVFEPSESDGASVTGVQDGTYSAIINGTWSASAVKDAWGENYGACKLPTFTCGGKQVQMSSFSGCKLIGVNAYSKNPAWAMLLAEFLTNEESQVARFEARGLGPSNIKASSAEAVQADPAIVALAEQAVYAKPQRVSGNYWSPAASLGAILAQGNPDGTDLQKILDDTVAGIVAPVA